MKEFQEGEQQPDDSEKSGRVKSEGGLDSEEVICSL